MELEAEVSVVLAQSIAAMAVASETLGQAEIELDRRNDRIERLEAVLREIVDEYDNTYDADQKDDGRWTDAASVPVEVMRRAKALLP